MARISAGVRVGAVAWAVALSVPLASASPVVPVLSITDMVATAESIPATTIPAGRPTHSDAAAGTTTLYVDKANGTKTNGCTGPGTNACQTVTQGLAAAIASNTYNNFDVTVQVAAGTYVENLNFAPDNLYSLTLTAPAGPSATIVDGGGVGNVFSVQRGTNSGAGLATISGFTVQNGNNSGNAGGITVFDGAKLAVVGSVVRDNVGEFGGAINIRPDATVSVTRSTISGNTGTRNGGGIHNIGSLTVTDSTITGNSAPTGAGGGGGIINVSIVSQNKTATLAVTGSTITGNTTTGPGGGIYNFAGTATVTGSTILGNTGSSGNAIFHGIAISTDVIASILGGGCGGSPVVTDGGTGGYNLKSDNTCGTATGDVVDGGLTGVSPTLAANGSSGPQTLALAANSMARKLVPAALCAAADERGAGRPGDDTQTKGDAGAFELQVTPGTPTNVTATAGVSSAGVVFTAPVSFDGVTVTGYTLTATDDTTPANGGQICIPAPPTATSCTFGGLTPGDSYTFTVRATGPTGAGAPSAPSNAVVPFTVPGAPTNVTATAGSSRATVSFAAPASNGFRPITGYTITATDTTDPARGGQTCTAAPGETSCTIDGLTNGDSYTFTVVATNAAGDGPPSAPSAAVVPTAPKRSAPTERSPLRYSTRCSGGGGPSSSNDPGPC